MGAEDFSFILNACEGAYIWIGNGIGSKHTPPLLNDSSLASSTTARIYAGLHGQTGSNCMLHNTQYDFNDDVLALGASYWVQLVKNTL